MTPKRKIAAGEFYHVYNRGVEKRIVFSDDEDYLHFIHCLYEFNDRDATLNFSHFINAQVARGLSVEYAVQNFREVVRSKERKLLVDIICFCLMPNHFHLMIRPLVDDGLPLFMQKLGGGFVKHFNNKYKRVGPLFQGRYKEKHISDDTYFTHCAGYIHRNPLELMPFTGERKGIRFRKSAESFLRAYRWSSYPDCAGEKNFPSVTNPKFLMGMFDNNAAAYEKFVLDWTEEEFTRLKEAKLTLE